MKLKLDFTPSPPAHLIGLRKPVWISGSCFATHMADALQRYRFNVCANPNGILFNPISILQALQQDAQAKAYTAQDCVQHGGLWHSFRHHGSFSRPDQETLLKDINRQSQQSHEALKEAGFVILTFGSTWVYEWNQGGNIVANCHKIPQQQFSKRLLKVEEITNQFAAAVAEAKKLNPAIKFLLTVSPVRYVRDGLVENNRSKAVLLQSVHELTEQFSDCYYFPAYEIVLDELRDYRFFEADLVHPNALAVEYVWGKFVSTCLDAEAREFVAAYEAILTAKSHRPLHQVPQELEKFKKATLSKISALHQQFPFIDLKGDRQHFSG